MLWCVRLFQEHVRATICFNPQHWKVVNNAIAPISQRSKVRHRELGSASLSYWLMEPRLEVEIFNGVTSAEETLGVNDKEYFQSTSVFCKLNFQKHITKDTKERLLSSVLTSTLFLWKLSVFLSFSLSLYMCTHTYTHTHGNPENANSKHKYGHKVRATKFTKYTHYIVILSLKNTSKYKNFKPRSRHLYIFLTATPCFPILTSQPMSLNWLHV